MSMIDQDSHTLHWCHQNPAVRQRESFDPGDKGGQDRRGGGRSANSLTLAFQHFPLQMRRQDVGTKVKSTRNRPQPAASAITERKQGGKALPYSEQYFRPLIERALDVVVVLNSDGTIRYESPSIQNVIGYKPEERQGKSIFDLIHPDDMASATSAFSQLLQNQAANVHIELRLRHKDGSWRSIEAVGQNLLDDPAVAGIAVNLRDITERKRMEEALRESEEKFRRLVEDMNDGYCVLQGSRVVFANARSAEMFGYTHDEVIGKTVKELLPPEIVSELSKMSAKRQRGEIVPQQYEISLVGKDGTMRPVELGTRVIDYTGKPALSVVIRDISERKRAQEDRQRMEQQLQLAGRLAAVGELAAGVAHELNNPLAAVQAFAQLLNDRDDLDETVRSDVETIYREAQRASKITSNMLFFARRHAPEKRLISINEVIEKALELHAYRMKVNNIDLVMELDPDLPMTMADFHQMQQVFVNIINNAEQAMTEAHGKGRLCIKTQKAGKMIQIAFTDDGLGISAENLKRLFDPFFTTKGVGKGTGLGLSICYGLVQEHGGRMSARSKPGEEATFVVEIPILSKDERTAQEAASIQVQEI